MNNYLNGEDSLPPKDSNWFLFALSLDLGVLDLDDLAYGMGFRNFADMDISISPRSLIPLPGQMIPSWRFEQCKTYLLMTTQELNKTLMEVV